MNDAQDFTDDFDIVSKPNFKTKGKFRLSDAMCSALVTPDNYFGMEEWYIPVIECPKCRHKVPARTSNYCSGCGVKLKLSTTVQNYVDSD
jgi:rRNA maturation endonuclease Nob1